MSSPSPPQASLAGIVSLQDRLPVRWHAAVMAAGWIGGIVLAALLTALFTDEDWLALLVAAGLMVLAAWRAVKLLAAADAAAGRAERDRAAMEHALQQSQAMEALGRLTVGVAHDFNNHLTVISSNVELVARRLDPDQDRLLRYTGAAMQGVRRAAILTGRLLSFSPQPVVEREAIEVDRGGQELSELLRRTLGERVRLEVGLSGSPWFAWADVNQMENALLSLVVNARDQVPDGGTLSIAVTNVRVDA